MKSHLSTNLAELSEKKSPTWFFWSFEDDSPLQNIIWLVVSILKNMKVSWDDEIPNIWKNTSHVPNHQPVVGDIPFTIWLFNIAMENHNF